MRPCRLVPFALLMLALFFFGTFAHAAPRQRVTWPWDRYGKYPEPPTVTAILANGQISATEHYRVIPVGTSPHATQWRFTPDRQWLIADSAAKFSCQGTQTHRKVGFKTNWDTRSANAGGTHVTKSYLGVKYARASELQTLCNVKGTWRSHTNNSGMLISAKEFSANYQVELSATCKAPLAPTRYPKTKESYTVVARCDSTSYNKSSLVKLRLHWSGSYQDNLTFDGSSKAGYARIRTEGFAFKSQKPGTTALRLFYSSARKDYFTTATAQGVNAAKNAGYQDKGVVGYVYSSQAKGTVPLKLFWNGSRRDNITVSSKKGQQDAAAAGYRFVRNEGYVIRPGPAD